MTSREEIAALLAKIHPDHEGRSLNRDLEGLLDEAAVNGDEDWIERQLQSWLVQFPQRRNAWKTSDAALVDIRHLLMGPQESESDIWNRLTRIASWIFDHYVAIASLIAICATVFYGLAYSQIYDAVNITPEEAGFTPAQVLTHSAVGGLAFLIMMSVTVFCIAIPLVPFRDDPGAAKEAGSWFGLIANSLMTLSGIVLIFAMGLLTGALKPAVVFSIMTIVLLLAVSYRPRRKIGLPRIEPRPLRFSGRRYAVVFAAVAVPLGLLFTATATFTQASLLSQRIERGEAVSGSKFAGMPFLGVRAEAAFISWRSREPLAVDLPRCALYLGDSDGDTVLYAHRSRSTFHVPADEIAVELRGDLANCDAPVNIHEPSIHLNRNGDLVCRRGAWESYLSPAFRLEWVANSLTIPVGENRRYGRRITAQTLDAWSLRSIHCRVTATTTEGEGTAVSRPVLLHGNGRALHPSR